MSADHPERDPLLDELAAVWEARDPAPSGLVERSLRTVHDAFGADDLDLELELLVLLDRSAELAGTRAGAGPVTLQFAGRLEGDAELQLLVRVTPLSADECRVDGWVTPDTGVTVVAVQGQRRTEAVVSGPGRFEFARLGRGETRLVVSTGPDPQAAGPPVPGLLGTHPFDL